MKMQDASQGKDPIEEMQRLVGLRPGVQETVNHTAHTQVDIPKRQAILAMWFRLISYLGSISIFVLFVLGVWLVGSNRLVIALAVFIVAFVLILAAVAFFPSRQLLLQRLEAEIIDPYHDDTLREIFESYLEKIKPPEPETKIVREGIPYRVYQNGERKEVSSEGIEEEPDEFDILIAFAAKAAIVGLARESVWCKPNTPRIKLSTGTVVTQSKWRQLCESLKEWGLVENDVKGSYIWVNGVSDNPQKAVEYLRQAKEEILKNADELWQPDEPVP